MVRLREIAAAGGRILFLTGAGISAESGVPTFRGKEGFWTVGSRNYHPQEMASPERFRSDPDEVWRWYAYRLGICRAAKPNAGHLALAAIERVLLDRFLLVTQNVDGLHRRAGQSEERTLCVHGDIGRMRCAQACTRETFPVPERFGRRDRSAPLTGEERDALRCPRCRGRARPHVLWFGEAYDEVWYRADSAVRAAERATLLVSAGTSGLVTLPAYLGQIAARRGIPTIDVNPEPNAFSETALASGGWFCRGRSGVLLPAIARILAPEPG